MQADGARGEHDTQSFNSSIYYGSDNLKLPEVSPNYIMPSQISTMASPIKKSKAEN